MPAAEIIRSVTTNAAQNAGLAVRVGALEPGKLADIIAVPGNPLPTSVEAGASWICDERCQVIRTTSIG